MCLHRRNEVFEKYSSIIAEAAEADETGAQSEPDITVPLKELAGSTAHIEMFASEIVKLFEERSEVIDGKAMIVCMSRDICVDMYDTIVAIRLAWHTDEDEVGSIKVVMDASVSKKHADETGAAYAVQAESTSYHGRTRARRERLANCFKDNSEPRSSRSLFATCG